MRFTVTWHPFAVQELTQIWLDAAGRDAVTQATNEIDRALADDPQNNGEEFYGDRLFVATPLAVTFAVHKDDRPADRRIEDYGCRPQNQTEQDPAQVAQRVLRH